MLAGSRVNTVALAEEIKVVLNFPKAKFTETKSIVYRISDEPIIVTPRFLKSLESGFKGTWLRNARFISGAKCMRVSSRNSTFE
jgi:hypothetical protein